MLAEGQAQASVARKCCTYTALQDLGYEPTAGDEVEDLYALLAYVKERLPGIEAVASGAIASDYQRLRVENVCAGRSLGYCISGGAGANSYGRACKPCRCVAGWGWCRWHTCGTSRRRRCWKAWSHAGLRLCWSRWLRWAWFLGAIWANALMPCACTCTCCAGATVFAHCLTRNLDIKSGTAC